MRRTGVLSDIRLLVGAPPALATRPIMARIAAAFFAVVGVMGIVVSSVIPEGSTGNRGILLVGAIISVFTGALVLALGRYLSAPAHAGLIAFATVVLTYMLMEAPDPVVTMALSCLYPCIACHAAFVFSWRSAAGLAAFALPLCTFGVTSRPELAWWAALLPVTSTVIVGTGVAILSRVASEADIDSLTGLLNRRGFDRALTAVTTAPGAPPKVAMVLFDLDEFKTTNDRLGHRAGDTMLKNVADRWVQQLGRDAVLARYGGDEFGLLLPNTTEAEAIEIADRMRAAIATDCSAGVTSWRQGDTASLFVGRADIGLYRAKATGRNQTMLESSQRPAVVTELRAALESGTVDVHYQPIVDLAGARRTVGYEALVRWSSSEQPELTPSGLITIAEGSDLIGELGRAVLHRACSDANVIQRATPDIAIVINVNVSCLELVRENYATNVLRIAASTGWPANQLVLEVTESELAADSVQAIAQLQKLRRAGVRIAIDDFGSGYSSLNRLAALPCDVLKIDRPVISDIRSARPMLTAIAALSSAFELELIIEGIESTEQEELLSELGISRAQGYLYGRPQSLDQITTPTAPAHNSPTNPTRRSRL
ncbi:bifunctional diguanylate cyclase/phosphodiesterase [Antrihabitans sp. YC2-6]|uniref:putative bifunctional diguanylate cyclase/phosphodiesterase n=1 Tax=Antrihabitans sp. YC2-6 TaxID=2799498 RepID=UPI0018F35F9D|nr:bifunctional diguanylate cyclase/phosphodiesterase [Antrihabitans sp. YC2-6]MBJ8344150.1 bifunctional diguanylate cyclase/phosphodiesterase [Antrihabitans sp. YC2-6]